MGFVWFIISLSVSVHACVCVCILPQHDGEPGGRHKQSAVVLCLWPSSNTNPIWNLRLSHTQGQKQRRVRERAACLGVHRRSELTLVAKCTTCSLTVLLCFVWSDHDCRRHCEHDYVTSQLSQRSRRHLVKLPKNYSGCSLWQLCSYCETPPHYHDSHEHALKYTALHITRRLGQAAQICRWGYVSVCVLGLLRATFLICRPAERAVAPLHQRCKWGDGEHGDWQLRGKGQTLGGAGGSQGKISPLTDVTTVSARWLF